MTPKRAPKPPKLSARERARANNTFTNTPEDDARWDRQAAKLPKGLTSYNRLGADTIEETRRRAKLFPGAVKVRD